MQSHTRRPSRGVGDDNMRRKGDAIPSVCEASARLLMSYRYGDTDSRSPDA